MDQKLAGKKQKISKFRQKLIKKKHQFSVKLKMKILV